MSTVDYFYSFLRGFSEDTKSSEIFRQLKYKIGIKRKRNEDFTTCEGNRWFYDNRNTVGHLMSAYICVCVYVYVCV